VCVVELASVLAREEFSDRPRCVCPVIAAYLRAWNDRAGYVDRQRLRPYAERIVGSRGDRRLTRERRDICLRWGSAEPRGGAWRRSLKRLWLRVRIGVSCGLAAAVKLNEGAGEFAARVAFSRGDHEGALDLLDKLLATGGQQRPEGPQPVIDRDRLVGPNGNGMPPSVGAGRGSADGNGLPAPNGNRSVPGTNKRGRRERERPLV
jgi:hypothetical protein